MRLGWLVLVVATLVAVLVGAPLIRDVLQVHHLPSAYAAPGRLDPIGRVHRGDADNEDADNEDADNEDDDFDLCSIYEELGIPPPASFGCSPSVAAPARPPEPTCTTPGRDAVFTSHDGKVALRVFGSSPLPVRVVLYQVINANSAPPPPGTYVSPLVYEVWAGRCDGTPVAAFPAEVNLGIRYSDGEAAGLDESRFVIGRLDLATATWVPVEKQASDPPANYVSATITEPGYYMVWEAR